MPRSRLALPLALGCGLLLALGLMVSGFLSADGCRSRRDESSCMRVLFIGNSYTFQNDLPKTFAALAEVGGHSVETAMAAEGGWRLADHVAAAGTRDLLTGTQWDYVVLQEQSQIPSLAPLREELMAPAARVLVRRIRAEGATPLFFMTWGHRGGWPEHGLAGYTAMQGALRRGYLSIARELSSPVAPAGEAWAGVRRHQPNLDLWEPDGSHPAVAGTYLAACVFYATVFRESPEGLPYTAGLPEETAWALQKQAADVVLTDPWRWGLE